LEAYLTAISTESLEEGKGCFAAWAIDVRKPDEAIERFTRNGTALESLGYKSSRQEILEERRGITGAKVDVASRGLMLKTPIQQP